MPLRSQFESLPSETLSRILTRCSRKDLSNLAQTCSNLRAVCCKELINYPFTMRVTPNSLKSWAAYFRKENTLLTQGARSLDIEFAIAVTVQGLLDAFDDVDRNAFDVNTLPTHLDASWILPLPSSLRKFSLKMSWMAGNGVSSEILFLLLLRPLPERCPHLEELSIQTSPNHPSDELDKCVRRLPHVKKLRLHVWPLSSIPNFLSLLPTSLTDLDLFSDGIQTQEEVTITPPWVRGIRKLSLVVCECQNIANVLMILSRGGATHLTELNLRNRRIWMAPAVVTSLGEALTVGLQEFSLLQPPLHALTLKGPAGWLDSLHLPLLRTAVASTLTKLTLKSVDSCFFPSHLAWPRLQSLELNCIPKMGYQGPLTEPIFPLLTDIDMSGVGEIQAPEDLFPALETINWRGPITAPEQIASLVRHDIKRIDMSTRYNHDRYEPLWEAMGGHTIGLISLVGRLPDWMKELAESGERIFPEFPNIQEFSIKRGWF